MNSYWCCIDSPHPNPYPLLASSSIAYIDTRSERSTIISPLSIMEKLYKRDNNERGEVVGDDWGGPQRPTQGCLIEEISHTVWSQKEIRPRIGNPSQDVIIKITNNNTNLVDNSYFSSYIPLLFQSTPTIPNSTTDSSQSHLQHCRTDASSSTRHLNP